MSETLGSDLTEEIEAIPERTNAFYGLEDGSWV